MRKFYCDVCHSEDASNEERRIHLPADHARYFCERCWELELHEAHRSTFYGADGKRLLIDPQLSCLRIIEKMLIDAGGAPRDPGAIVDEIAFALATPGVRERFALARSADIDGSWQRWRTGQIPLHERPATGIANGDKRDVPDV